MSWGGWTQNGMKQHRAWSKTHAPLPASCYQRRNDESPSRAQKPSGLCLWTGLARRNTTPQEQNSYKFIRTWRSAKEDHRCPGSPTELSSSKSIRLKNTANMACCLSLFHTGATQPSVKWCFQTVVNLALVHNIFMTGSTIKLPVTVEPSTAVVELFVTAGVSQVDVNLMQEPTQQLSQTTST